MSSEISFFDGLDPEQLKKKKEKQKRINVGLGIAAGILLVLSVIGIGVCFNKLSNRPKAEITNKRSELSGLPGTEGSIPLQTDNGLNNESNVDIQNDMSSDSDTEVTVNNIDVGDMSKMAREGASMLLGNTSLDSNSINNLIQEAEKLAREKTQGKNSNYMASFGNMTEDDALGIVHSLLKQAPKKTTKHKK